MNGLRKECIDNLENKDMNNTWRCMRKSYLKGYAEALICSAQKQSIQTAESPLCRMCRTRNETISHIVSE